MRRASGTGTSGKEQYLADRAEAAAAIMAEGQRFNNAASIGQALVNDQNSAVEAESIRRGIVDPNSERFRGQGFKGQETLENMNILKRGSNFVDAETVRGQYVDPISGTPVLMEEPATNAISGSNTPDTAQMANAPKSGSAIDWVAKQVYEPRAGESSGGDLRQVDIGGATAALQQRLGEFSKFGNDPSVVQGPVRNIAELQQVADQVVQQGNRAGHRWLQADGTPSPRGLGKLFRRAAEPGVAEVMNLIRMPPGEQAQLANALYQMEMAGDSPVKERFMERGGPYSNVENVRYNAIDAMPNPDPGEGNAPLARIAQREKIGPKGAKVGIVNELNKLDDPMARNAVIGQVAGEPAPVRKRPPGMEGAGIEPGIRAIYEGFQGPFNEPQFRENVANAQAVEGRYLADEAIRAAREQEVSPFRVELGRRRRTR